MERLTISPLPGRVRDLTGQSYGQVTILGFSHQARGDAHWVCRCECGTTTTLRGASLKNGNTRSCGCIARGRPPGPTRYDDTRPKRFYETPEYHAWENAKGRCYNPNDPRYADWGGRGIVMCEGWRTNSRAFCEQMGARPSGCQLDRIDNDGNYSCGQCAECRAHGWPLNCRWATLVQQRRNRRCA